MFPDGFLPKHFFQPKHDKQRTQPKTTIKSIFTDFASKVIPLPIWLWNILVVVIHLRIGCLVISVAIILLVGIASLFF